MQLTPARSPMPSRPSLPPPKPPEGAKQMKVKKLSQSTFSMSTQEHRSKEWMLSVLFLVLCMLIGMAILIAKTGIYDVPFFSVFYKTRPVTRVVVGSRISNEDIVRRAVASASSATSSISFLVSEQEMTGTLIAMLQSSSTRNGVFIDSPQIVSTPSGLEVSGGVRTDEIFGRVSAKIIPVVENGKVSFSYKEVYLGDLPVPTFVMERIMEKVFESKMDAFNIEIQGRRLDQIILNDGSARLIFEKE